MAGYEDEAAFLRRRAGEERRRMAETSCMVRSVHEDLAELYDERGELAEADSAALEELTRRIP